MSAAPVTEIIKVHKLSEPMLRALYTGEEGEVVACGVRTERALIARNLIHPANSTLTEKGTALLAELRGQGKGSASTISRTAADLPKGTRVVSHQGRTGTVSGLDVGRVTLPGHSNYGREYVGVNWDAVEGDMGCNRRSRPFVDELTMPGGCAVSEPTIKATPGETEVMALLRAVYDALDLPMPDITDEDEQAHARLFVRRADDVRNAVSCVLRGCTMASAAEYLRVWTTATPVTYTPWEDTGAPS